MCKGDLISQLAFSLDIKSYKIENINEEFYLDSKRPDYDEATYNNMDSKEFDKFLGMYVELPGEKKESKVLDRVKERQLDHKVNS